MKEIPLTKGKVALVDDEDYDWLSQWNWHYMSNGYAARSVRHGKNKTFILMHRQIAETPDGLQTDHINGEKLDNRRGNLRVCTASENRWNMKLGSRNKTGYKGVYKRLRRYVVMIAGDNGNRYIGTFATPEEAALAYDEAAREKFGKFAKTNF